VDAELDHEAVDGAEEGRVVEEAELDQVVEAVRAAGGPVAMDLNDEADPFDFLTQVQRQAKDIREHPERRMPWDCTKNLPRARQTSARVNAQRLRRSGVPFTQPYCKDMMWLVNAR
jgi:hypothetical protein